MNIEKLSAAVGELYALISRLRGPGGCPWDAQQTDATLKMYLLEEAYEVLDALEHGGPDEVCGELGDLLFQIAFLAYLAEERGEFDLLAVLERIVRKMIHRHPHVFGPLQVRDAEEVARNWAQLKAKENGNAVDALESIPAALPALLRSQRLLERASKRNPAPAGADPWHRAESGFEQLRRTLASGDDRQAQEDLGKLLFGLVEVAREHGINPENALRLENQRFLEGIRKAGDGGDPRNGGR